MPACFLKIYMKCPFCDQNESCVLESRDSEDGQVTRRRRECLGCNKRFTTYERIEKHQLVVGKRDGSKENFDKDKLKKGVVRACEKREVSMEEIEKIVDQVEVEMMKKKNGKIPSKLIGNSVLRRLKTKDKVAYVRFASVYLDFDDITDFSKVVREIK